MSVLCTGSIAIDQIMVFHDHFMNHILPEKIHAVNVSFYVPTLEKRFGGTAANIAFHLRILGIDPVLLATVGSDFGDYADWMDEHGVRRNWIKTLDDVYTAQCFITTDLAHNQINSFHPGAMDRAHEATLESVDEDYSVGIVSPNGKQGMVDYAAGLKERGKACVIDPGQAMGLFDGDELISLLDGASVYIVNDYEWSMTLEKTGQSEDEIAERVGAIVITRGAEGSRLRKGNGAAGVRIDQERSEVAVVKADQVEDPTGCGDAYRSGILYALANDLPLEIGARIGSLIGSLKVAVTGPQGLKLDPEGFRAAYRKEYGESF
ncbi:MAG: carbohydrate kinase family protein [Deltaproteobacteria bacterium]|nr:carbohydrate kinase family protein [Deltaproteobacteria bacterium]MBW2723701.1 carbohydrate kinase family protein [Deltaproteobacteria bacterium]